MQFAKTLKANPDNVKSVNFSYNQLLINEDFMAELEDALEIKKV